MRTDDSSAELDPGFTAGEPSPYTPEHGMRPRQQSFVRICVEDPYEDDAAYSEPATLRTEGAPHRDSLANDQLNLTVNLLHLRRLLQGEPQGLLTPEAAARIGARLGDLEDVREAIETVLKLRGERVERMLASGASLSAYLKGLYLYCEGIVETFEEALSGLASIDGRALRFRLGEASQFYFEGLIYGIREELGRDVASHEALAAAEQLFFAATFLNEQILSSLR
jgi:hypothetical protein